MVRFDFHNDESSVFLIGSKAHLVTDFHLVKNGRVLNLERHGHRRHIEVRDCSMADVSFFTSFTLRIPCVNRKALACIVIEGR